MRISGNPLNRMAMVKIMPTIMPTIMAKVMAKVMVRIMPNTAGMYRPRTGRTLVLLVTARDVAAA
jgi:hypothetical protein